MIIISKTWMKQLRHCRLKKTIQKNKYSRYRAWYIRLIWRIRTLRRWLIVTLNMGNNQEEGTCRNRIQTVCWKHQLKIIQKKVVRIRKHLLNQKKTKNINNNKSKISIKHLIFIHKPHKLNQTSWPSKEIVSIKELDSLIQSV
jgi:hypothetical protein